MAATTGAMLQPTAVPIIRGDGDGERRWFAGGSVFTMKATAAETNGTLMLSEHRMTRGKVTPLHLHPDAEETLIVIEGELVVHHEGVEHRVGSGGVAVFPRGVPHAFMVTSETARILALLTPGSAEAFYRAASEPVTHDTDADRPPDWDRLRTAAAHHPESIQVVGPPPFGAGR